MVRTIIVDDEPLARKGISNFLDIYPDIKIVAECEDGFTAVKKIERLQPDLVFLDIQMPEMTGFEVIKNLRTQNMPLIIFVTAYDEFALKAFQASALDYLLKPVDKDLLEKALERVRLLIKAKDLDTNRGNLQKLLKEVQQKSEYTKHFLVRENQKLINVSTNDITSFEASGDYVCLITPAKKFLVRSTLANLEKNLDPYIFRRIHRSTIVRIDAIKTLEPLSKGDYQVTLKNGKNYILSRNYRESVLKTFN